MAVKSTKVQSTMVLKIKTGLDSKGKDIIKKTSFSKVKVMASDENILAVGSAMGALLNYPVTEVVRQDSNLVINE